MSAPLPSVASPVWVWLLPLLSAAKQLECAATRAPGPLHVLTTTELRALGVISMRARGLN
jgi:hypothetical protein